MGARLRIRAGARISPDSAARFRLVEREVRMTTALLALPDIPLLRRRGPRSVPRPPLPASLVFFLLVAPMLAQQNPPTASENVVVTATAAPEPEGEIGAATTVITRERIREEGFRTV